MVLLLSILQSTLIYAEERVYGISDYGPVSVNGNGVGRGKDPTYQYIEDLLYNQGNNGSGNSGSANSGGSNPAANPGGTPSQNTTKSSGQNTAVTQERKWNLAKLSGNGQTKSIGSEVNANYVRSLWLLMIYLFLEYPPTLIHGGVVIRTVALFL